MNKILILYPEFFNCHEKFCRKISRIISNIDNIAIFCPADKNNLIGEYLKEKLPDVPFSEVSNWELEEFTHAIIFDDGDEFPKEIDLLKSKNIPLRVINIKITRVVNIKIEEKYKSEKSTPDYEYIGRGSYWGNPYSMYEEGDDRDEVIRKYKYDFDYEKFPNKEKSEVYKLAGKRLGCFCKPQTCHGDVLADYLNSWDDGK